MQQDQAQSAEFGPAVVGDCGWRGLELFAGMGGMSAAWPELPVAAAIDINRTAALLYQRNRPHAYWIREIESLTWQELQRLSANFWWLSPPCQPFSRRGRQQDVEDPRTRPLVRLLDAIAACRPPAVAVENVIGFANSRACELLRSRLEECGYGIASCEICPSQMGWPNRRPRFYLLAGLQPLLPWQSLPRYTTTVAEVLEPDACCRIELRLSAEQFERYAVGLDRIDASEVSAVTACFAGSYGKTLLHAGSYLRCETHYRRFSPREVARLLGYPDTWELAGLPLRTAWKLLGNSLSLPVVRYLLSHLPGGPTARLPWLQL